MRERGWGSPNSDDGTDTVVLYIYKYFVVCSLVNKRVGKKLNWLNRKITLPWLHGQCHMMQVFTNTNRLLIFEREGKKVTMQWANIVKSKVFQKYVYLH